MAREPNLNDVPVAMTEGTPELPAAGLPSPTLGALGTHAALAAGAGTPHVDLAGLVAVRRRALEQLREQHGAKAPEVATHERTLRALTDALRRSAEGADGSGVSESLKRAANVLEFEVPSSHRALAGQAVTAAKRALMAGLKPFHAEVLRPQHTFNLAYVRTLEALLALRGGSGRAEEVKRRLEELPGLATPTAWQVRSHRRVGAGSLVGAVKRSYLAALGPVLAELLEGQARWNARAVEALAFLLPKEGGQAADAGPLVRELRALADPLAREGLTARVRLGSPLWREVLRQQARFNDAVVDELTRLLRVAPPVERPAGGAYADWLARHEPAQREQVARALAALPHRPLLSVVAVAGAATEAEVRASLASLAAQTYPEWELWVAAGQGRAAELERWVAAVPGLPAQVRVVEAGEAGEPAPAVNAALAACRGELVALLELGDTLAPHALAALAVRAATGPGADVLYVDEDRLEASGARTTPFFKPGWSPDLLRAAPYWGAFVAARREVLAQVEGLRAGLGGQHWYDLALRLSERTPAIDRVAGVLVHRRPGAPSPLEGLTAEAAEPARRVLAEHLARLGEAGEVSVGEAGTLRVRYPVRGQPRVSVVVPFKDKPELLDTLVTSFLRHTRYENVEFLLVSNNSTQPETFALLERLTDPRIRKLTWDHPFNYSAVNNFAARHATGELLLFLNNDIEVIEEGWLEELVSQAQRPEVGAVGARLLFPEGTLQHVGVVVGLGGYAGHPFALRPRTAVTAQGRADWTRNYLAVTSACVMLRREVFEAIGGYDETFLLCGSDVELCLKAVQRGLRVVYTPFATLVHHESATRRVDSIPEVDFWRSFVAYRPYLQGGDPFYNPHLSLLDACGALRETEEAEALALGVLSHDLPSTRASALTPARAREVLETSGTVHALDCPPEVLARALAEGPHQLEVLRAGGLKRICWFVPGFGHPYGGVHTILRFADLLRRRHGVQSTFVVYDGSQVTAREMEARVAPLYPEPPGDFVVLRGPDQLAELPPCDLAIATFWTSAWAILRYPGARARAYFVQDAEPMFYGAGGLQALCAQTYRMGFYGVFNTRGLYEHVTGSYPMEGCWFEPTVERRVFHPERPARSGPVRIFFYARPSTDRNAFELGLAALRQLKQELGGAVDIVTAGERWDPAAFGVEGVIRNLGVLPYERTGDLYRQSDVGLCFMFTKHPSYLPFEMMACGVTVVTNDNPANLWLLEHERNCLLAEPTHASVMTQLRRAVGDAALRARIGAAASERVCRTTWEEQVDRVHAALVGAPAEGPGRQEREG